MTSNLDLFNNLMNKYLFVKIDRWGGAGRNVYLSNTGYCSVKPDVIISTAQPMERCNIKYQNIYENEAMVRGENVEKWIYSILNKIINENSDRTIVIMPFVPLENKKIINRYNNVRLIQIEYDIYKYCESKTLFESILKNANVDKKYIPKFYNKDNGINHEMIEKELGIPYIIQCESMGGRGTKMIDTKDSFYKFKENFTSVSKISQYIEGDVFNFIVLNVPSTESECNVYVEVPSFKPMNIKELNGRNFSSCGNEWGIKPFKHIEEAIINIKRIGQYLYKEKKLKGLWGVDVIYNDLGFKIIEINARLQGTVEVNSYIVNERKSIPHLITHCAVNLGVNADWMLEENLYNNITMELSKNIDYGGAYYIKIKRKSDFRFNPTDDFKGAGKYKILNEKLQYQTNDAYIGTANLENDEILIMNTPKCGVVIKQDCEVAMVEGTNSKEKFIYKTDNELSDLGKKIVDLVGVLLNLPKV